MLTRFTLTFDDGRVQECRLVEKDMKRIQYFDMEDVTTRYLRWDALEAVKGNTGASELALFGVSLGEGNKPGAPPGKDMR